MDPVVRKHMPELDTLRGVAILLAFTYHGMYWTVPQDKLTSSARFVSSAFRGGWSGVQLFFVLSGFLITGILFDSIGQTRYFRTFYWRRALRILPAFTLTIALLVILGLVSWKFTLLSVVFLANVSPLMGVPMQYPVLWSLAVEEHFYALWPAIVYRISARTVAIISATLIIVQPLFRGLAFSGGYSEGLSFYTWFNLDGLALGALLAFLGRTASRKTFRSVGIVASTLGVSATITLTLNHLWSRTTLWGAAFQSTVIYLMFGGLLVSFLVVGSSSRREIVNVRILQWFGYISYGLYLIHLLCFDLYDRLNHWGTPHDVASISVRFAVAGGISIAAAALSRTLFENRFLALKDRTGLGTPQLVHGQSV